jgi:hypothetical protein
MLMNQFYLFLLLGNWNLYKTDWTNITTIIIKQIIIR